MTDESSPPVAVGSTAGLGPLPDYGHDFRPRWIGDEGGFTGAQMRLYAMQAMEAERERCAAMCECVAVASENGGGKVTGPFGAEIARKCAALILKTRGA